MKSYKQGKTINSLEEMSPLKIVYVVQWKKTVPVAFFKSWQWRLIEDWIKLKKICYAEKIENLEKKSFASVVRAQKKIIAQKKKEI